MSNWLIETELEGDLVKLIPLQRKHRDELVKAAADGELWKLWFTSIPSEKTIDAYLDYALTEYKNDRALPFVVVDKTTNQVIGTTRFCNANSHDKRLEVGFTWYAKRVQRTGVNTECKYLLLSHAFENLKCIAVELRTHWHNRASRNAIARLGAKQDGVLRNHQIDADGAIRDTVVFSILREEWLVVKKSLKFKMGQY
ncbi:N-acetylglutamate synthase [Arcticibacter svalbardensis MN12-7]|uniref:N-acetylglutamate synthase n=1 Tax=Arcticibacter svalbardensis MN12-7 TaxID=1150600 RepID=R9H595_9SPHI|nr:GNAT family protein [Arcticibacter svalbardensis]EOR96349.1 N-acetylglutamate synthase [Arcticibacter svalbardensis MN12-7]